MEGRGSSRAKQRPGQKDFPSSASGPFAFGECWTVINGAPSMAASDKANLRRMPVSPRVIPGQQKAT